MNSFRFSKNKFFVIVLLIVFFSSFAFTQEVPKQYGIITDLPETSACLSSIKLLFDGINIYNIDQISNEKMSGFADGLIVFISNPTKLDKLKKITQAYTKSGGTIFMDIRTYTALNNISTKTIELRDLFVSKESEVMNGYKKGDVIRYNAEGMLLAFGEIKDKSVTVLAKSDQDDVVMIQQQAGKGKIIAVDVMSLNEPEYEKDTENKYSFLVNAIGNRVKYGRNYLHRYHYHEIEKMIKDLSEEYPEVRLVKEGKGTFDYSIYSMNIGNPSGKGIVIVSATHGNEWENTYGVINFIQYLAQHKDQKIIDLNKYYLKVIPALNPFGYQNLTRQNGNLVDLNRNGDNNWEAYRQGDTINYKPGEYDWKGSGPFSEPETQILRSITETENIIALLDIHGNPSGTGYNKWMGVANTTRTDAYEKAELFKDYFNESLKGRYVLRQYHEKTVAPFLLEKIQKEESTPMLISSLCKDKYGYIIELYCGYLSTEFIVMQTDITCEVCIAFCKIFSD